MSYVKDIDELKGIADQECTCVEDVDNICIVCEASGTLNRIAGDAYYGLQAVKKLQEYVKHGR